MEPDPRTPLVRAVEELDLETVRFLLHEDGRSIDERDLEGRNAIETLAERIPAGDERPAFDAVAEQLLGAGADPLELDLSGTTPAARAARALNVPALVAFQRRAGLGESIHAPRLLEAGLDRAAEAIAEGDAATHERALATVQALLAAGCSARVPLREGEGAVAHLVHKMQRELAGVSAELSGEQDTLLSELVKLLVDHGADGQAATTRGDHANEVAADHGWGRTSRMLPRAPRRRGGGGSGAIGKLLLMVAAVGLVGAAGAAFWLLPRGWLEEVGQPQAPATTPADTDVAVTTGSHCGSAAVSPDPALLHGDWSGYRCASRRAMGVSGDECLAREQYTDHPGRGCPDEQLCCPAPEPIGMARWWCLCYAQRTLEGEARGVTDCYPTHEACERTQAAAEAREGGRSDVAERCRAMSQPADHPKERLGVPELWRLADGGESYLVPGMCLLSR